MSAILDSRNWSDDTGEVDTAARGGKTDWPAILVVLGGLAAGGSAALLTLLRADPAPVVLAEIGGTRLTIPASLLRLPGEVADGAAARVDLLLSWPDLGPVPRRLERARQEWRTDAAASNDVVVTLSPADDAPAPETRVTQLYARFLEHQVLQGPGDLLTRHFKKASPYQGEVLIFSPPDGRTLAARCETEAFHLDPLASGEAGSEVPPTIQATCIAEFRRKGLDVQLRFPPRLAGGLDAVQRRLMALIGRMSG